MVISAQASRLPQILDAAAAQEADLVVIDTAPRAEQGALAAAKAADLVLIPCRPAVLRPGNGRYDGRPGAPGRE